MIHDCIALQINDIFSISMIISEVGCVDSFNWRYADIYLLRKSLTVLENLFNHMTLENLRRNFFLVLEASLSHKNQRFYIII